MQQVGSGPVEAGPVLGAIPSTSQKWRVLTEKLAAGKLPFGVNNQKLHDWERETPW